MIWQKAWQISIDEVAYLSKQQRRIVVAYYFENRKQTDIAKKLGISPGTVKWHLFEAYGLNGSMGTKSMDEFFRSTLSQNICYCVRNKAKTINEITEELGVSPVYVESEAEFLEEYLYSRKIWESNAFPLRKWQLFGGRCA